MVDVTDLSPLRSPENAPFWAAAANGRLLIKFCRTCGEVHWYPRPLCPFCFSDDTEWRPSDGLGEIYTYTIMRGKGGDPAHAVGYVQLLEGPMALTNFVDCDYGKLRIGLRVKYVFKDVGTFGRVLSFTPANDLI